MELEESGRITIIVSSFYDKVLHVLPVAFQPFLSREIIHVCLFLDYHKKKGLLIIASLLRCRIIQLRLAFFGGDLTCKYHGSTIFVAKALVSPLFWIGHVKVLKQIL
ncbi:hypothetical protein O6H91_04G142000 [Diphasiastrum complanatum]|uniref:Uncharacterized protein n=2 Tax=Diphasiastrum complanatum TaxID=34168 RepID=A0ACC2E351_DIPCM|nr:hypothetical protein O6H91_04G141900 [Diphasiastrum complanatum]KAJ7560718.1 hypothetical protein O6H91_04G142000 [Diphasiastrum complanatum]